MGVRIQSRGIKIKTNEIKTTVTLSLDQVAIIVAALEESRRTSRKVLSGHPEDPYFIDYLSKAITDKSNLIELLSNLKYTK